MEKVSYKLRIGRKDSLTEIVPTNDSRNAVICCVLKENSQYRSSVKMNSTLRDSLISKTYTKGTSRYFVANTSDLEFTDVIVNNIEMYYRTKDKFQSLSISSKANTYRPNDGFIYLSSIEEIIYANSSVSTKDEVIPVFIAAEYIGSYPNAEDRIFYTKKSKDEFVFRCNKLDVVARTKTKEAATLYIPSSDTNKSLIVKPFIEVNKYNNISMTYDYGRVVADRYEVSETLKQNASNRIYLSNQYLVSGSLEIRKNNSLGYLYPETSVSINYITGELDFSLTEDLNRYKGDIYIKYTYNKMPGITLQVTYELSGLKTLVYALPTKIDVMGSITDRPGGIFYICINSNGQIVHSSLQNLPSDIIHTKHLGSGYYESLSGYVDLPFANSNVIEDNLQHTNYGAILLGNVSHETSDLDVIVSRRPSNVKYLPNIGNKKKWICTLRQRPTYKDRTLVHGLLRISHDAFTSFNTEIVHRVGNIYTLCSDIGTNHTAPVSTNPLIEDMMQLYDGVLSDKSFDLEKIKTYKVRDGAYGSPEEIPMDNPVIIDGKLTFQVEISDEEKLFAVAYGYRVV